MENYSILVVDDSETDRYILKRALQKTGIITEVFEAENGGEALDFLEDYDKKKKNFGPKFPPVIIFLDINMPHVDGFEFLESFSELRKTQKEYKSSVLIMFSSSENEEDKEKVFSYDFVNDFIDKGNVNSKDLKIKIDNILNNPKKSS